MHTQGRDIERLKALLIKHEGMRLRAYLCPTGKITVGVGRNLEDLGISESEALILLENDIKRFQYETSKAFPWFLDLSQARRDVITCMVFNMGLDRFLGFRAMIAAIQRGDFDRAASEMLNSRWAAQVKGRAVDLADLMRKGDYQP